MNTFLKYGNRQTDFPGVKTRASFAFSLASGSLIFITGLNDRKRPSGVLPKERALETNFWATSAT